MTPHLLALWWVLAAPATPTPTPGALSLDAPNPAASPAATPSAAAAATPVKPEPTRAAVVVVGADASAAGDLQRDLEKRLAASVPGLAVRVTADVTMRVGVPRPAPTPPPVDPVVAALMEEAISAYYQAQFVTALDLFAKAQGHNTSTDAPVSRRTEVFLWRVAVFLGLKDVTQAQAEALAALTLNPELKVAPTSELPPSVGQQLDIVRASASFKLVTVLVNGLPATASLTVDGRSVPSRFKVVAGKHRLVASSKGRRDVIREFQALADTAITVSLPPALSPEADAAVLAFTQSGVADAPEPPEIASLAQNLDADWVVFAAVTDAGVHGLLRRTGNAASTRVGPIAAAEAGAALAETFARTISSAKRRAESGGAVALDDGRWNVQSRATLIASGWLRSVEGGEEFQTFFGGAGPEIRVEAVKGRMLLVGAGSWVSYDASSVEVTLPDGSRTTATGGSTARLVLGGGWRGGGEHGGGFRALATLDVESHDATDPSNGGAPLNLMTGYTRAAAEVRGGFRMGAPGLSSWNLDLELGVSPYAYFAEDPSGATGASPASGPAFLWSGALESAPTASSRWGYRLAYSGEMRSVTFKGRSEAAVNPPMRDATLSEMYHALSLSLTRRF